MDAIDWDLAQWIGERIAGHPPNPQGLPDLTPLAESFVERVAAYTTLRRPATLPPLETVDRAGWIEANLASLKPILEPLAARGLPRRRSPFGRTPSAQALRGASALLVGAQVGALAGLLSQRVLGQYDLQLLGEPRPARLLLVAPNLSHVARALRLDRGELARWVAIHELTHAVQFGAAGWLQGYLGSLVEELVARSELKVAPADLLRALRPEGVVALFGRLRRGEVLRVTVGERRWQVVERIQAAMSLIEGHAEHVMDAVGAEVLPSLKRLRSALERRRRERRPPPWRLLERLLGLELKLRQYEQGRCFCEEVVKAGGPALLARAFAGPELLPRPAELATPRRWLSRVA